MSKPHIFSTVPTVYYYILGLWIAMMLWFETYVVLYGILPTFEHYHFIYGILIIISQIFVAIFFYFGFTNLLFPLRYQQIKQAEQKAELKIMAEPLKTHPRVQLLYTTYNDFIPYAFEQCLQQTYDNVEGVILDNSTDEAVIAQIKQFVDVHPDVKWVRNTHNEHAKAGNLTQYLNGVGHDKYDYFVILDADELIQPTFVENSLKFFQADEHLGILQANHISGRNENQFMTTFAKAADTFWPVQNTVRSTESGTYRNQPKVQQVTVGDTLCIGLGHGVMVSKACYEAIGQFPYVVAEDLTFSFEAIMRGFNIKFASQIYGNEQFPIDMEALSIRSAKFCSANFQFFKLYGKQLLHTHLLTPLQKLDLISFTLSVPIFAINYVSLLLNSLIFPLAHISTGTQWFMIFPTLLCYFSQSLADVIFQLQNRKPILSVLSYAVQSAMLYGNAYYLTVKCTLLAILHVPAKFNVTPKTSQKIKFKYVVKANWESIVFSLTTIVVCMWASQSGWILISFLPGVIGFSLAFKANHKNVANRKVDAIIQKANQQALQPHHQCKVVDWRL